MKKYFYFAAALLFAAISCTKETPDTTAERPVSPELSGRKTIVLNIAGPDTKTYVSNPATGAVSWETGDVVGVFTDKDVTAPLLFTLSGEPGTSATFTGEVSEGASHIYVFYPYSADATFADGKITMTLPSEQSVGTNNVAKGAMVTVGEATKGGSGSYIVHLHNAFSYIKFKITGDDVKEIVLSGGSDKLAGTATFSVDDGSMVGTGTVSSIRATKADGYFTKDNYYYIPVLPGSVDALSFSMTSNTHGTDTGTAGFDDWKAERVAGSALTFTRGTGLKFDALDQGTKWNWYFDIRDAASLERFRALVAADNFPADGVAKFTESFTVADGNDLADADGTFTGSLIGNNNTLTWTANGKPLFKTLNGEVSSLNIAGTVVPTVDGMFGTIAETVGTDGVIDGCKNYANGVVSVSKITAWTRIGMLAGFSQGIIKNSENHGALQVTVTGNSSNHIGEDGGTWIGGIAGQFDASGLTDKVAMKACVNKGPVALTINGTSGNNYMFVGGITGGTTAHAVADAAEEVGSIDGCYNYESVSLTLKNGGSMDDNAGTGGTANYSNVGGIAGYVEGNVTNCYNGTDADHSNVTVSALYPTNETEQCASRPAVGGIAGYVLRNVSGCYNYGNISAKGTVAGGGVANAGNGISQDASFGGIVGQIGPQEGYGSYKLSDSHNYANLEITAWMSTANRTRFDFGGVAGYSHVALQNCTNKGKMTVESKGCFNEIGGVVGWVKRAVSNLENTGTLDFTLIKTSDEGDQISEPIHIGGVVGFAEAGGSGLHNAGTSMKVSITGTSGEIFCGGAVGKTAAASNLTNSADVTLTIDTGAQLRFGGVVGNNTGTLSGTLTDDANLTLNLSNAVKNITFGGVVGWANGNVEACTNGTVKDVKTMTYKGSTSSNTWVGGCVAYTATGFSSSGWTNYEKVYIEGMETKNARIAGVLGDIGANGNGITDEYTYSSLINHGSILNESVTATGDCYVGGVSAAGTTYKVFNSCTNYGDIDHTGNIQRLGGCLAYTDRVNVSGRSTCTDIAAECDIKIDAKNIGAYVGGVLGYAYLAPKNMSFKGTIDASSSTNSSWVGGIQGHTGNGNPTFDGCYFSGSVKGRNNNYAALISAGATNGGKVYTFTNCKIAKGSSLNGTVVESLTPAILVYAHNTPTVTTDGVSLVDE